MLMEGRIETTNFKRNFNFLWPVSLHTQDDASTTGQKSAVPPLTAKRLLD